MLFWIAPNSRNGSNSLERLAERTDYRSLPLAASTALSARFKFKRNGTGNNQKEHQSLDVILELIYEVFLESSAFTLIGQYRQYAFVPIPGIAFRRQTAPAIDCAANPDLEQRPACSWISGPNRLLSCST